MTLSLSLHTTRPRRLAVFFTQDKNRRRPHAPACILERTRVISSATTSCDVGGGAILGDLAFGDDAAVTAGGMVLSRGSDSGRESRDVVAVDDAVRALRAEPLSSETNPPVSDPPACPSYLRDVYASLLLLRAQRISLSLSHHPPLAPHPLSLPSRRAAQRSKGIACCCSSSQTQIGSRALFRHTPNRKGRLCSTHFVWKDPSSGNASRSSLRRRRPQSGS